MQKSIAITPRGQPLGCDIQVTDPWSSPALARATELELAYGRALARYREGRNPRDGARAVAARIAWVRELQQHGGIQ